MERSSLPPGEYFVTELLTAQPAGKIIINSDGGFSEWNSALENLNGGASWVLLLSLTDPTTSVNNPIAPTNMQIMPNPSHDYFQIVMDDSDSDHQLRIFNAAGVVVFQTNNFAGHTTIHTNRWARGMYVVQVSDSQGKLVAKEMVAIE